MLHQYWYLDWIYDRDTHFTADCYRFYPLFPSDHCQDIRSFYRDLLGRRRWSCSGTSGPQHQWAAGGCNQKNSVHLTDCTSEEAHTQIHKWTNVRHKHWQLQTHSRENTSYQNILSKEREVGGRVEKSQQRGRLGGKVGEREGQNLTTQSQRSERSINKCISHCGGGQVFHPSLPLTDLWSRNTYTVDDVDVAIECRQIGSDYVGIPNAEALENNAQLHTQTEEKLESCWVHVHVHVYIHTYPLALANFPKCGGKCVHGG